MHRPQSKLLGFVAVLIVTIASWSAHGETADAPIPNLAPKFDKNVLSRICDGKLVVKSKLANFLIEQYNLTDVVYRPPIRPPEMDQTTWNGVLGQPAWQRLFLLTPQQFCKEQQCSVAELARVGSLNTWVSGSAGNSARAGLRTEPSLTVLTPDQSGSTNDSYLDPKSASQLGCNLSGPDDFSTRLQSAFQDFRLRAYPGQIVSPHNTTGIGDAYETNSFYNNLYFPNQNAQLGLKSNSGQAIQSSIIGAIGYEFDLHQLTSGALPPSTYIVPYVATDRESGKTKAQPYSTNTFDVGVVAETFVNTPGFFIPGQTMGLRPDYLWNWVDGSRLVSVNYQYIPYYQQYLNQFTELPGIAKTSGMVLLTGYAQLGSFTNAGHPADPGLNHDFARIGGQIGPALELKWLDGSPIDLVGTYTDYLAPEGFHKSLGLLQASATWNFTTDKLVGLTGAYINGRQQDSAQRIQAWSLSLSLHY